MIIKWTPKANLRLTEIFNYCLSQYGASVTLRFKKAIDNDIELLSKFPYMGKMEELYYYSHEIRSLVEGHYKILYFVNEAITTIYIIDIFDCRQNPSKLEDELN